MEKTTLIIQLPWYSDRFKNKLPEQDVITFQTHSQLCELIWSISQRCYHFHST